MFVAVYEKLQDRLLGEVGPALSLIMRSHYETLGVSRSVQPEQIKHSYRVLVKRFHPDLFPVGSPEQAEATARLKEIIGAYAILSDPSKRRTYDAKLVKRVSFTTEAKPEYCHRCGRPTLYWQIGREQPLCNRCGEPARH